VYVNNIASVKIWDSLGFTRAGLVPKAGRLRKARGAGNEQDLAEEEYVDAILFWRDFATPLPARQT
jgi:RimJ/RimL family protein N-acetyltransferase